MREKPTDIFELEAKNLGYKNVMGVDEVGRGCEHPSAEILTCNGWKHYSDILPTDNVLSYTPSGNIVWQPINAIIEKEYEGNLIELKNRSIHILVTPEHCFDVVRRKFRRDEARTLRLTDYVFRGRCNVLDLDINDAIPRGGKWEGLCPKFFTLPSIEKNKFDSSGRNYSAKAIPIKLWLAFMGLYLSEGSCGKYEGGSYVVSISQTSYSKHFAKMHYFLTSIFPFKFKYDGRANFICRNKQLYMYLKQFGYAEDKFISNDIKNLDLSLLRVFFDWLMMGDGCVYTRPGRKEIYEFYTSSVRLRDDVEETSLKLGYSYKSYTRRPRDRFIEGRLIKAENTLENFKIRLRRNIRCYISALHKSLKFYKGKVFCLSLPTHHNFYVRRSDSGYFTGNSLCGPVVAAGVIIPDGFDTSEIRDSKQLSAKKRAELCEKIKNSCFTSISQIDAQLIDEVNIREATKMAMRNVINSMILSANAGFVLIDGDFVPNVLSIPARPIIGGDRKSVSIAAASIIAKVWRDRELETMHVFYPVYNWKKNKGYGTKEHLDAIKIYGITKYHRKTFGGVKEYVPESKN